MNDKDSGSYAGLIQNMIRFYGVYLQGKKHGMDILEIGGTKWKGCWEENKPVTGQWSIQYRNGASY